MADPQPSAPKSTSPAAIAVRRRVGSLRVEIPAWQAITLGLACVAVVFALWWFVTRGSSVESRIVSPTLLPSPAETFGSFRDLWFEQALTRNLLVTLQRVTLGFLLAVAVGVPLGIAAGCFTRVEAFLQPLIVFGRNIPIAALIPLTFIIFGIGETQKVMFIFLACIAFVVADAAQAVRDIDQRYIDTAYTLGAGRFQTILKVLVPLALPNVFNSLRLLFGLAFGYIMLSELIKIGGEAGGLGYLISVSQRRNNQQHIYLILIIIPLVAFGIDRFLLWVQRELFPHRYGGSGMLNTLVRHALHGWEDFKGLFWKPSAGAGERPSPPSGAG